MTDTPHLALPLIAAAQAQKHVTHNEALLAIDALLQCAVADRDLATPPGSPAPGDRYIVAAGAAGAWSGQGGSIAVWQDGAWTFRTPRLGFVAFVVDESLLCFYGAAGWVPLTSALGAIQNLSRLGIGTAADATNPFAAKLNTALWTARTAAEGGNGDLRYTLNRESAADIVSFLFQTGYSAGAELGLLGDGDLVAKTSADGATWRESVRLKAASGLATFPSGLQIPNRRTFTDVALDNGTATYGGAFNRLPLSLVNADTGNNWDNANHWYVCPRAGIYQITGSLRVGAGGDVSSAHGYQYGVGVYTAEQDGPWFLWHAVGPAPSSRSTYSYSRLSYQSAGDQLRMFAFSDQGIVVYRAGLQIVLVSDAV